MVVAAVVERVGKAAQELEGVVAQELEALHCHCDSMRSTHQGVPDHDASQLHIHEGSSHRYHLASSARSSSRCSSVSYRTKPHTDVQSKLHWRRHGNPGSDSHYRRRCL